MQIWRAAVDAVRADRLVEENVRVDAGRLEICGHSVPLDSFDKLIIVGAGKAASGMTRGLLKALPAELIADKHVAGWINVPENCVESLPPLIVHPARPAGVNEPTAQGVYGSERILELVGQAGLRDICICLLSGGGSALLPAPIAGVKLEEKTALIRFLSDHGANIEQLNTVRKELSLTKGNGLARHFHGQHLFCLIISDVIGDPLDMIASGPTVPSKTNAQDALAILAQFDPQRKFVAVSIYNALQRKLNDKSMDEKDENAARVSNHLIGNLEVAVKAAAAEGKRLGFKVETSVAKALEGDAESVGRSLAEQLLTKGKHQAKDHGSICLVSGGEPTVQLVAPHLRGKGGRNQQLVLSAFIRLLEAGIETIEFPPFCLLSGGTDGEDGPTDAAGAVVDNSTLKEFRELNLDPLDFLHRNDAYHFFEAVGGLIKTGPTHTNVCDVRVAIVGT